MLTEFRLLATPAKRKPCIAGSRVPLDTRFRGYDKAGFPEHGKIKVAIRQLVKPGLR
jgi:hypothetical protein